MSLRIFPLGLALLLTTACSVDDLLVGAPCNDDGDCPALHCVRTATQAAAGDPGQCASESSCVRGEQEGCQATAEGACSDTFLTPTEDSDGTVFCCGTLSGATPRIVAVDDDGTAECASCGGCNSSTEEACLEGEDRCVVEDDAPCGCRLTDAAIENTECDDDADCGDSLSCVRTLEQREEPDEPQVSEQGVEAGLCRSDDTCFGGTQAGCLLPSGSSCGGSTESVGVGPLTYCCPEPTSSAFIPLVYAVADDESSAACTTCERSSCPNAQGQLLLDECTNVSDGACDVEPGALCGCPPMTE